MNSKESAAVQTRRGQTETITNEATSSAFTIQDLRRVSYGKVRAEFWVSLGPVSFECRLIVSDDGAPAFVAPVRVKEFFSQQYRGVVRIDKDLAVEIFEAVVARLKADFEQSGAA